MFLKKIVEELLVWAEDGSFSESLTIDKLSKKSGYSKGYIQKVFKDVTGMTFGHYVRGRRLTKAAFILRFTKQPIYSITKDLNFQSYQSFERAFRKQFKISPLQYRKTKTWDLRSATPLLFLEGLPQHNLRYLPCYSNEGGEHIEIEYFHFDEFFIDLRANVLEKYKDKGGAIICYRIDPGNSSVDLTSVYIKTEGICSNFGEGIPFDLAKKYEKIDSSRGQLYAEFNYHGSKCGVQHFLLLILAKSFPINKIGIMTDGTIEIVKPVSESTIDMKVYIPIANKDVVMDGRFIL
jgi:AraC family transcriptional activator of mar-sox-rob regulon